MKRHFTPTLAAAVLGLLAGSGFAATQNDTITGLGADTTPLACAAPLRTASGLEAQADREFGKLPLHFEVNQGQANREVRPRDAATGWRSWLANPAGEIVASFSSLTPPGPFPPKPRPSSSPPSPGNHCPGTKKPASRPCAARWRGDLPNADEFILLLPVTPGQRISKRR